MWKFLFAFVVIISIGEAQRSSYAPKSNSKLLPRYRNQSSTPEPSSNTSETLSVRGGEEEEEEVGSNLPQDLQGTLEDEKFVQRVSKWPAERQPFWFKNRHAISSMRGRETDGGSANQVSTKTSGTADAVPRFQSPFFGPSNVRSRTQNLARFQQNDGPYYQNEFLNNYQAGPYPRYDY